MTALHGLHSYSSQHRALCVLYLSAATATPWLPLEVSPQPNHGSKPKQELSDGSESGRSLVIKFVLLFGLRVGGDDAVCGGNVALVMKPTMTPWLWSFQPRLDIATSWWDNLPVRVYILISCSADHTRLTFPYSCDILYMLIPPLFIRSYNRYDLKCKNILQTVFN